MTLSKQQVSLFGNACEEQVFSLLSLLCCRYAVTVPSILSSVTMCLAL